MSTTDLRLKQISVATEYDVVYFQRQHNRKIRLRSKVHPLAIVSYNTYTKLIVTDKKPPVKQLNVHT